MSPVPPVAHVDWPQAHRIVSSRFPPVGLFDEISDPRDLEALYHIEGLTNPRIREEMGAIALVPPQRRVAGPGTTPIMAAFTHPNPEGSRFSPGTFGVYYAAQDQETAIRETVHHRQRFFRSTDEAPCRVDMRCYIARIVGQLHDIRGGWPELHDPQSYVASQRASVEWKEAGAEGIVYSSVRSPGGHCVTLFYPDLVSPVVQGPHLTYHWDGSRITSVTASHQVLTF